MESNVAQLGIGERLLAWFELHRKQVLWGAAIVLAAGAAIGFYLWQQSEKQARANEALSRIVSTGFGGGEAEAAPPALLNVAAEHPGTAAAGRALLLAAGHLYEQGKYAEARTQFERFLRDYRESPLAPQALFGVASCLDALGKTSEAVTAYNDILQHYSTDNVAPQAQLALARLSEKQGKWAQARELFMELARSSRGSVGSEAMIHLEQLVAAHPELARQPVQTNIPNLRLPHP